jgi:hypothetical protein
MLSTGLQANVIGPNKDGIYKVDQWGAPKSTEKKKIKLNDNAHSINIESETALITNFPTTRLMR